MSSSRSASVGPGRTGARMARWSSVSGRSIFDLLDIDRDLDADGPGRHGQRVGGGACQHADRVVGCAHAVGRLRNTFQHGELVERLVHRAHLAIGVFAVGVAGEVQHGRAGHARLEQAADGVGRARPGAGYDDAELSGRAGIAVCHVRGAHFAARGDEAHHVAPADGVQQRQIVHRCDAEHGARPAGGDELRDEIGHRVIIRHDRPPPASGLLHRPCPIFRPAPRACARPGPAGCGRAARRPPAATAFPT